MLKIYKNKHFCFLKINCIKFDSLISVETYKTSTMFIHVLMKLHYHYTSNSNSLILFRDIILGINVVLMYCLDDIISSNIFFQIKIKTVRLEQEEV